MYVTEVTEHWTKVAKSINCALKMMEITYEIHVFLFLFELNWYWYLSSAIISWVYVYRLIITLHRTNSTDKWAFGKYGNMHLHFWSLLCTFIYCWLEYNDSNWRIRQKLDKITQFVIHKRHLYLHIYHRYFYSNTSN